MRHKRPGPPPAGPPVHDDLVKREFTADALYPFGHGLSYTSFAYGTPQLSTAQLGWEETLEITTTVTNTGAVAGETVVQLYVHDRVASRVRPVHRGPWG